MAFTNGIDVSKWQGNMNWAQAKSAGAKFAFIRASSTSYSTGAPYRDTKFEQNAAEAHKHLAVGFYHFFRPIGGISGAINQANFFCDLIQDKTQHLKPVADVEAANGATADQIQKRLLAFISRVQERLNKRCIIYTRGSFWNPFVGNPSWAGQSDLWIARYSNQLQHPWGDGWWKPYPWDDYTFWQWSADGNFQGAKYGAQSAHLDLNRFNGDENAFNAYLGDSPPPPPPGPVEVKGHVWVSALNVRSGPSTGYGIVDVVRFGDIVTVYDVHKNWIKISKAEEKWIHSYYVESLSR